MAASGSQTIQLYYSTTASTAPVAANLVSGELAINITDGKLYYKDNGGTVQIIGYKTTPTTAGGTGLTSFTANGVVYASSTSVLSTGSSFVFDGTNVGIGTSSPATKFQVYGTAVATQASIDGTGRYKYFETYASGTRRAYFGWDETSLVANLYTDANYPIIFGVNGTEQMRLNGTGLGIGTSSPSYKLDVLSTAFTIGRFSRSGAGASAAIDLVEGSGGYVRLSCDGGTNNFSIRPAGTVTATFDSSGNLGLGVTPSAWGSGWKTIQIGNSALTQVSSQFNVGYNNYYDGTSYKYINTDYASIYLQGSGTHKWYNAPSGTAGNAISFTQAMTLDASGNLGLGTTSLSSYANQTTLTINGTSYGRIDFNASNVVKGSIFGGGSGLNLDAGANQLLFYAGSSERMRIDSSGNLLVGTTSNASGTPKVAVNGSIQPLWGQYRVASVYDNSYRQGLYFDSTNRNMWVFSTTNDTGGNIIFSTRVGAGSSDSDYGTERMRIDSSGNLSIGQTQSGATKRLYVVGADTGSTNYTALFYNSDSSKAFFMRNDGYSGATYWYATTTASAANVYVDSNGGLLRSTSALKYKQDIRDLEKIDINKFRPVRYKSKCEGDDQTKDHFGVIADEVAEAGIEELVVRGADGEVEGFQYERLTVVLVKAIQEQQAIIEQLKARLDAAKL